MSTTITFTTIQSTKSNHSTTVSTTSSKLTINSTTVSTTSPKHTNNSTTISVIWFKLLTKWHGTSYGFGLARYRQQQHRFQHNQYLPNTQYKFTHEEIKTSNIKGVLGKHQLDPNKMQLVEKTAFQLFPLQESETIKKPGPPVQELSMRRVDDLIENKSTWLIWACSEIILYTYINYNKNIIIVVLTSMFSSNIFREQEKNRANHQPIKLSNSLNLHWKIIIL